MDSISKEKLKPHFISRVLTTKGEHMGGGFRAFT
jgi:hypothetical protein